MKIIQVGCSTGNDHVTNLVNNNNVDFLLLVEANPFNIDLLKECYINHNYNIENIVITPNDENKTIPFYYSINDAPNYEVSSIKKIHVMDYYNEDTIKEIILNSSSINLLLEKYNIIDLDYLFLDIEGIDAEVALSLNLEKYNIKHVQLEFLHLKERETSVIEYFNKYDYTLHNGIDSNNYDKMFIKNNI